MECYKISKDISGSVNKELVEYPELLRQLLFNRDITTRDEAEMLLNPSYEKDLHDPFLMLGMEKAVERVLKAVENDEKIVIFGDYDCDGIPGSVILHDFFKKIGYENFSVYIPDRHEEGYGLHEEAIRKFGEEGVKLLITVDLGITDVKEVECANQLGIDVIITDHHLSMRGPTQKEKEALPPAYAILNPKQENDSYPFDMLCGAGVVFKLVQALVKNLQTYKLKNLKTYKLIPGWEKWLLDMAGLATLSDMVPLRGENRALAHFGLKVLRKNRRLGLQKLFQNMNIDSRYVTEDDVSFMIIPRINAASRMDKPRRAFEMMATEDEKEAGILADHLTQINDQRKTLVAQVLRDVKRTLTKRDLSAQAGGKEVIVIGNPKWRLGILGLVASRLVDEYQRPVFVWCKTTGLIKGSCRSDGSVNLVEMMSCVKKGALLDFGGHELAGGFSVSLEQIHFLEDELIRVYRETQKHKSTPEGEQSSLRGTAKARKHGNKELLIDKKLSLDDVMMENYKLIEQLGPFGIGNPKPTFLFEGLEINGVKKFGKDKNHLELSFKKENGERVRAISFFVNDKSFDVSLEEGSQVNLVASFEKNVFRNRPELRLRIVDIF